MNVMTARRHPPGPCPPCPASASLRLASDLQLSPASASTATLVSLVPVTTLDMMGVTMLWARVPD